MPIINEGQGAISKDGKTRVVYKGGQWVKDDTYVPASAAPGAKVDTSAADMKAMTDASAKAEAERDSLRTYAGAAKAVDDMDTGPVKAAWLDAIVPDEDGGILDKVGGILGTVARPFVSQKTLDARDQLKTVNANVALAGSQQMKGSSSDKDTALMRLSGIGPAKRPAENHRIIDEAIYNSGREQARALVTADWIGKYGSLSNRSRNGMTFEEAKQRAERYYDQRQQARKMPKAPPSTRKSRLIEYDIQGNQLN